MAVDDLVQKLIGKLKFDEQTILQDASEQPLLFMQAADYRIKKLRSYMQAKLNLSTVEAELAQETRQRLQRTEERTTEKRIEEIVKSDKRYRAAQEQCNAAEMLDEAGKLVLEAFRHRRDCLRVVAELTSSSISLQKAIDQTQGKLTEARRKVADKYAV